MKRLLLIFLVFTVSTSFCVEKNLTTEKKEVVKKEVNSEVKMNFDDALKANAPFLAFFYTTKACACTNKKCSETLEFMKTFKANLPKGINYTEVHIPDNETLAQKYKVMAPPALLFMNAKGDLIMTLQSWEINKENIEKKLKETNFVKK